VVERTADLLNDRDRSLRGSRILLVGISYKKDLPDLRESPALKVMEKLHQKGAIVSYHDPLVPSLPWYYHGMESQPLSPGTLKAVDCVVLLTDHTGLDCELLARHAPLILDTRNALKGCRDPHVVRL